MMTSPSSCSLDWEAAGMPAWGTAKVARVIVAVEVPGAWGRDAVGDSGLPQPADATLYLIRRVGRHAVAGETARVFVGGGFGDEPWLVEATLRREDVTGLLAGDVAERARLASFGFAARPEPVLLVCTNGRRDACCAVRARPVAEAAHAAAPDNVWEVSHIGGHRFAPTAIHLPSGQTFGRLTGDTAAALATASTSSPANPVVQQLFSSTTHRGRIDLEPVAQVAETWWRQQHPDLTLAPVSGIGAPVANGDDGWLVSLPDGTSLTITSVPGQPLRDSCLKAAKPSASFVARLN
ncbi:hypothetical protein I6I76_07340 [Dermacoccus nishinomiyaensis]|uniref:sucrase ferredoxin n=1 Tax=Dermacoccus TaxID=57495 RepID=UPI0001E63D6D|nr:MULTISPECIES: sucrase ferredoxin [Dermacoccus]EFP57072.1 Sucrase/ferredoxin-like protein [Dermacoccus sp. Ellin185]QQY23389.1 hypothetical protein I6I76_07340 [Dermacoccus nishinomiyaensis]STD15963.1 Uncharacterized protein conserved in bacteria containing thioredoxin-like domain [Dermacoccus nishinomiyaensis]